MRRAALLLALLLAGCGGSSAKPPPAAPAVTGPVASCASPSPIAVGTMGPEITGRRPAKIVWRKTGSGPLTLAAYDAGGRKVPLAWGPEAHGGSNYERPGEEWGGGYRFPRPGCYRLTMHRTVGSAEAWIRVRA